jgi:hypothetical protein
MITPDLSGVQLYAFLGQSGRPHVSIFSLPLEMKRGVNPDLFQESYLWCKWCIVLNLVKRLMQIPFYDISVTALLKTFKWRYWSRKYTAALKYSF